nr:acyl-CoA dehydrogenase family protein [uncultured Bacillus sp.]
MLNLGLTKEQQQLQQKVRAFVEEYIMPNALRYDEAQEFPSEVVEAAAKIGLLDFSVPKEFGGPGLDTLSICIISEELGRGDVTMSTTIGGNGLAAYPVLYGGNEEQKKRYFQYLLDQKLTAFALTEPAAGSDAGAVQTIAILDGDEYVLNGTKCFCTNGGKASVFTLIASTDPSKGTKGLSGFMIEADREGIIVGKKENKMGLRGSNTVEIILNNVRVPKENLIGKEGEGFKLAMITLDSARLSVGAAALGLSKRILEDTLQFLKTNTLGGKPMIASQYVQFKVADMATEIEAAQGIIYKTCYLKDSGERYSKEAAMAKTYCTDTAMKLAAMAVDLYGPYGYLHEAQIEKYMRDVKVMQIYEGTNEIQRVVIANNIAR